MDHRGVAEEESLESSESDVTGSNSYVLISPDHILIGS
jgi:aromatic ring-opening dioxygenase LigB subunit